MESHFEHRSSNISDSGENVAHAQPSVSQEEEEIQNSTLSSKCPSEDNEEDDRKPAAKRIKQEPQDGPLRWTQEETEKPPPKPWGDKNDYQAIFTKYISVGEDGEED